MALPSKDDLQKLDFAVNGAPFTNVGARAAVNRSSLDAAYLGSPFYAAPGAIDPLWSNVVSLMHFNGSGTAFTDRVTSNAWTASGSATQSSSSPLYGAASLSIPNTSSYIKTTSTPGNFNFGIGDFEVEFALEFDSTQPSDFPVPIEFASATGIVWQIYFDNYSGSQPYMYWWTPSISVGGLYHATDKAWSMSGVHYLAYSRVSGVGYLYFDGARIATAADTSNYTGGTQLLVGQEFDGANGLPGKYDELRVTKGIGRYTGTSYETQTSEFWQPPVSLVELAATITELESVVTAVARNRRVLPATLSFTEGVTISARRVRALALAMAEAEAAQAVLRRTRSAKFAATEGCALSGGVRRTRRFAMSVAEAAAYSFVLANSGRLQTLSMSIAEVEGHVIAVARSRKLQLSLAELEALSVATLKRVRRLAAGVASSSALSAKVIRGRTVKSTISESLSASIKIARLRKLALLLAEQTGYSFSLARSKQLEASVVEAQLTNFGTLRRVRRVAWAFGEVATHSVETLVRKRGLAIELAQSETLVVAVERVRELKAELQESLVPTLSLARAREVKSTIGELEQVEAKLSRTRLIAYAVSQTQVLPEIFLARARSVNLGVHSVEDVQYSMNRARAVIVQPVHTSHSFNFNVGRMRTMLTAIAETEGVEAAIQRLRLLASDVAQTVGVSITLKVHEETPFSMGVQLNWLEWDASPVTDGAILKMVSRSEAFSVPTKGRATGLVELEHAVTLTVGNG